MFSVHCPSHGTEVLLSDRRIEAIVPLPGGGHALRWRCWCDTVGTTVVTRDQRPMVGRQRPAV